MPDTIKFKRGAVGTSGSLLADGEPGFDTTNKALWIGYSSVNYPMAGSVPTSFAMLGDLTPSQITASQNNYTPTGLSTASVLRLDADAARDITGLAGGSDGRILILHNIGAHTITLKDESGSSTAGNRFALVADFALLADACCILQYDSTSQRWRVMGGSMSAAQILAALLTVDGAGSGLDADLLDGQSSAAFQSVDATLTAFAALTIAANSLTIGTGADAFSQTTFAANTFPARASSGSLEAKTITDFGLSLVDDATASDARTTLGLVIGTNVQAQDAELAALAGLTSAADRIPYFTGSGTASLATFSAYARTLVDDADAATARATLGLVIGTNVQAQDAELAALAGLTSAADKLPYFTGSGTAGVADFTAFGRSLADDADAAAGRTTLALGTIATQAANNVAITGGTINGAVIGGSTPAAGTFTTGTFTTGTFKQIALTGNVSSAAWTTAGIAIKTDFATYTDTSSSGTVALVAVNVLALPTLAASNVTTYTDAVTLSVTAPLAGSNVTITNQWAIDAGHTRVGGRLTQSGGAVSLTGNAPSSLTTTSGAITISGQTVINLQYDGSTKVVVGNGVLTPGTSDATALGTTALMWSDLFLASGAVVNFNNGDATITHAANVLAFDGAVVNVRDRLLISAATPNLHLSDTDVADTGFAVYCNASVWYVGRQSDAGTITANLVQIDRAAGFMATLQAAGAICIGTTSPPSSNNQLCLVLAANVGDVNPGGINTGTAGLYAKTISATSELYSFDGAGNFTLQTAHATDGPEWLYDWDSPHPEQVDRSENAYTGTIEWCNNTRKARLLERLLAGEDLSTLPAEQRTFRHTSTGRPRRDWDADQNEQVARREQQCTEQQARKAAKDAACAAWEQTCAEATAAYEAALTEWRKSVQKAEQQADEEFPDVQPSPPKPVLSIPSCPQPFVEDLLEPLEAKPMPEWLKRRLEANLPPT